MPGTSADGPIDRKMIDHQGRQHLRRDHHSLRGAARGRIGQPGPVGHAGQRVLSDAYPEPGHPRVGLVASEERMLTAAAATFKKNEEYDAKDKLVVVGHADVRGPASYNMALSRRRAEAVKAFLVSQGVPADRIDIRADGKQKEVTVAQVQQLQAKDAASSEVDDAAEGRDVAGVQPPGRSHPRTGGAAVGGGVSQCRA